MSYAEDLFEFQIKAVGIESPVREFRFHPKRRWRFDFAWPAQQIAVEIEGGTWANGRHTRGKGFEQDCEKYNEAALMGWTAFRVTSDMVRDGRAVRLIEGSMQQVESAA